MNCSASTPKKLVIENWVSARYRDTADALLNHHVAEDLKWTYIKSTWYIYVNGILYMHPVQKWIHYRHMNKQHGIMNSLEKVDLSMLCLGLWTEQKYLEMKIFL